MRSKRGLVIRLYVFMSSSCSCYFFILYDTLFVNNSIVRNIHAYYYYCLLYPIFMKIIMLNY